MDCFEACHQEASCFFSAYRETRKECLFFKEAVAEESIARLMAENWQYGRVSSKKMVSVLIGLCSEHAIFRTTC